MHSACILDVECKHYSVYNSFSFYYAGCVRDRRRAYWVIESTCERAVRDRETRPEQNSAGHRDSGTASLFCWFQLSHSTNFSGTGRDSEKDRRKSVVAHSVTWQAFLARYSVTKVITSPRYERGRRACYSSRMLQPSEARLWAEQVLYSAVGLSAMTRMTTMVDGDICAALERADELLGRMVTEGDIGERARARSALKAWKKFQQQLKSH